MNHRIFICLIPLLSICCFKAFNQSTNPCGVVASIYPATADSVVAPNTIINLTNISTNATSVKWLLDGYNSGITANSWNYVVGTGVHPISLVAYNGNCRDTTTVVYFAPGKPHDVDSLLLAHYGTFKYNEEPTCIDKTLDSGFIAGGVQYLWDACGEAGVLVKLRQKGCIDWSKKFLSPYYCNNSKINAVYASADTNYYVLTGNAELAKLDRNGNLLWNKRYLMNNQYSVLIQSILTGDSEGSIYLLCNSSSFNFFNGWGIAKLDKNGNIVWNKLFRLSYDLPFYSGQYEYTIPSGMVLLNGKLYVCGNAYSKSNSTYFSFLTKLNPSTGNREWQYGYTDPEPDFIRALGFIHLTTYDTLLMASSASQGHVVTLIDQQGTVRKSIKAKFATTYAPKVTRAAADKKGHIFMMQWTEESLPLQPYYWYATNFAEIDTSLNKYWGMVFSEYSRPDFIDATVGLNNKFAAVGTHWGFVTDGIFSSRDIRLLEVDTVNSEEFCYAKDNSYSVTPKTINQLSFEYLIDSSLSLAEAEATPYTVVDAFLESRYNCPDFVDSCSLMKLSGPVNLCSLADTYTYRVHRNKKCVLIPQWKFPAGITIVNQTDTSLSIKFSNFGTYTISAKLDGCVPVKDSLVIKITSKSHPLNLGSDTIICTGSTIKLHAAPNFFLYQWNDGSTDSILNVSQPGLYWVETIDSCNNHLRDSINITPFYLPMNVGPDRVKCNNDTLHLNGPAGFISYAWANNYNINATSTQNVVVNPSIDTAYYLKAEKLPGCFAYDTVKIKVYHSPPINLGGDISFCSGDSAMLIAPAGFTSYQWSNGVSLQQTIVKSVGAYSIVAATADGCKSNDTLKVLNVYPNPVVHLDHRTSICIGDTRVLDAGSFASYTWNDGSASRTFSVSDTGMYYVHVVDNNGCKGGDTTAITTLLPLPAGFLPQDTAICSYGSLRLTPLQNFRSYLWTTGESAPSISITKPGIYWLQVTDNNDCKGKDTIIVNLKECMKGLYVPTAFTPNHDGKNDEFKALLFGNIKFFELTVYNRWGEVVFRTNDPLKGWDGRVAGIEQNTAVFVWICRYQLEGDKEKIERGTVTLIR